MLCREIVQRQEDALRAGIDINLVRIRAIVLVLAVSLAVIPVDRKVDSQSVRIQKTDTRGRVARFATPALITNYPLENFFF
jgi:hypothetical protein